MDQSTHGAGENVVTRFERAFTLHENGQYHKAESAYLELVKEFPDIWLLHFNLGLLLFELSRHEEALVSYKEALNLTEASGDLYYNTAICQKALGHYEDAIISYQRALKIDLNDIDSLYNLGGCYLAAERDEEAIRVYRELLRFQPEHLSGLNNLAYLCHKNGFSQEAAALYAQILELDPGHVSAEHMLAALNGATRNHVPSDYIREVFDQFARHYETSLVEKLNYQLPAMLLDFVFEQSGEVKFSSLLDLGCGTGLVGEVFAACCPRMSGIDLSAKMVEIASSKSLYQDLQVGEIISFLGAAPARSYELVIAADVLPYIGDLTVLLGSLLRVVKPNALFCFSVEDDCSDAARDQPRLLESGRFGHSSHYVKTCAEKTGWLISASRQLDLRKERNGWIRGCIYALKCPPGSDEKAATLNQPAQQKSDTQ
jgi:predicted TPR repeat methyltransferase